MDELIKHFGKSGIFYYKIARSQDDREVEPNRIRKSVGAETTFEQDLDELLLMKIELGKLSQLVKERLDRHGTYGRTLTLKVKYADFQQSTRSVTVNYLIQEADAISTLAENLLSATDVSYRKVRLLGISISNLEESRDERCIQLSLELDCISPINCNFRSGD